MARDFTNFFDKSFIFEHKSLKKQFSSRKIAIDGIKKPFIDDQLLYK